MAQHSNLDRPWWKEPMIWLIGGLPLAAVVASFVTYFIASGDPDSLVREGYRKEGFAVTAPLDEADKAAAALGVSARISVSGGRLELQLRGGPEATPARLALSIIHPTQEKADMHIRLVHTRELSYIAPTPDVGAGKRILVLEPEDRSWRITGQWTAPFAGMAELAVTGTNPSTRP